jgi:hypothetical protein
MWKRAARPGPPTEFELDGLLAPVGTLVRRLEEAGETFVKTAEHWQLPQPGGRPPQGTRLWLFGGLADSEIDKHVDIHGIEPPAAYRTALRMLNGASLFDITLFGMAASMRSRPPRLDRMAIAPLDISVAAGESLRRPGLMTRCSEGPGGRGQGATREHGRSHVAEERRRHRAAGSRRAGQATRLAQSEASCGADSPDRCIGARHWSWSEDAGYFMNPRGEVTLRRAKVILVDRWPDLGACLEAELPRAEERWPVLLREWEARP